MKFIVGIEDVNKRLDHFVTEKTEYSRSFITNAIKNGDTMVNGMLKKSGYKLRLDDLVELKIQKVEHVEIMPEKIALDVIYEDKWLAVINKQAGLTVHPTDSIRTGTLVNGLLNRFERLSTIGGIDRQGIVHRLDKDTTGLIAIAKDDDTHVKLQELFGTRTIRKKYFAIVFGKVKEDGIINKPIGRSSKDRKMMAINHEGKESITKYHVISNTTGYSILDIGLETGRTHQIRVHMKSIHHPIVGDKTYGQKNDSTKASRQMLHSYMLDFIHPVTNERLVCYGKPDSEFLKISGKLGLDFDFEEYIKNATE